MNITLYHCPRTRSSRIVWLLEELGVPYEITKVDLQAKEHRQPPYLHINPFGKVPTLKFDDLVLHESGAICLFLGEKFPEKKLLSCDPELRAQTIQWCFFSIATLERTVEDFANYKNEKTVALLERLLEPLNNLLCHSPYLVNSQFSVADLLLCSVLNWARSLQLLKESHIYINRYLENVKQRPAFQKMIKI